MSYDEVKAAALALSDAERELLATEISVPESAAPHPHAAEWAETVNRRLAEVDSGAVRTVGEDELLRDLRERGIEVR